MEKEELINQLENQCKRIEINLTKEQKEQFYRYMQQLIEWNEKINLTAITDPKEIIQKHFVDSLTIAPYIKENDKVIDVGTGAGFPGIPIKIVKHNSEVILLDSLNKRLNFLNEIIKELQLDKMKTIHGRAEDIGKDCNHREKYDIAVSRAVAPLNVLVEYLLPFVKLNGICICMKASNADQEIEEGEKAIKILGGSIEKIDKIYLPDSDMKRKIIIIKKVKSTPNQYPRKAGMPSKQPIQ